MDARLLRKVIGGGLLLAALLAGVAGCSLHVHPVPGVSVHIPVPAPDSKEKHD